MSAIQKIFIALALTAAVGTGGYEAHQTFRLRERERAIRQQQAPLVHQVEQLERELNEATNRLASMSEENQQWNPNSIGAEIQKLKARAAQLQATRAQTKSEPGEPTLNSWLNRVGQLKRYLEQHPDQGIPEFKFLTDREWLLVTAPEGPSPDWNDAIQGLKMQAEPRFAGVVEKALQNYAQANGGQFPGDLSQLQPDCDADVEDILQERYDIKPASILPARDVKALNVKTDWVIAGKEPMAPNTGHIAIYINGYTYW